MIRIFCIPSTKYSQSNILTSNEVLIDNGFTFFVHFSLRSLEFKNGKNTVDELADEQKTENLPPSALFFHSRWWIYAHCASTNESFDLSSASNGFRMQSESHFNVFSLTIEFDNIFCSWRQFVFHFLLVEIGKENSVRKRKKKTVKKHPKRRTKEVFVVQYFYEEIKLLSVSCHKITIDENYEINSSKPNQ